MTELLGMSAAEIREITDSLGMPAFRAKQISKWISFCVFDFDGMTNISMSDRERLAAVCRVTGGRVADRRVSSDLSLIHI